ncbi:MAG TPA: flagellar basal body rod protein FlgB [Chloroflexota bacterium]
MIPGLFGDTASRALRTALGGLQLRQQTVANNVANVDTPGFRAQEVSFEEQLRAELAAPQRQPRLTRLGLTTTNERHIPLEPQARRSETQLQVTESLDGTLRNDGNTVDIDREMSRLAETQISYNALAQVQISRFANLRNAIREGR